MFDAQGVPRPDWCALMLLVKHDAFQYHVKILFKGNPTGQPMADMADRRRALESLTSGICFKKIYLLPDTISEIEVLSADLPGSQRLPLIVNPESFLRYRIREDEAGKRYPKIAGISLPRVPLSDLTMEDKINPSVFIVMAANSGPYVYKSIDRPDYRPSDTDEVYQELRNLQRFRDSPSIVQPIAVVVSENPWRSSEQSPPVIRGFLLPYHLDGNLGRNLDRLRSDYVGEWIRWPFQIAEAVDNMHRSCIPHMDIRPAHVVIDHNGEAILIDVKSMGRASPVFVAPEIRDVRQLSSLPFESQRGNDIWALGKTLECILAEAPACPERRMLMDACICMAERTAKERPPLSVILFKLSQLFAPDPDDSDGSDDFWAY